jgi:hypothetical protein
MPRTEIKMPKEISNLKEYLEWVKSMNTENQDLIVCMKRRTNFHPYAFTEEENGMIDYLIDDTVSRGFCSIKRFNQVFKFEIITYNWNNN